MGRNCGVLRRRTCERQAADQRSPRGPVGAAQARRPRRPSRGRPPSGACAPQQPPVARPQLP
eukprot:15468930-Alexandrium_andersonii.AAC.1